MRGAEGRGARAGGTTGGTRAAAGVPARRPKWGPLWAPEAARAKAGGGDRPRRTPRSTSPSTTWRAQLGPGGGRAVPPAGFLLPHPHPRRPARRSRPQRSGDPEGGGGRTGGRAPFFLPPTRRPKWGPLWAPEAARATPTDPNRPCQIYDATAEA